MTLAELLREGMKRTGLSQQKVADRLGVGQAYVSQLATGTKLKTISAENGRKVAKVLGIDFDDLRPFVTGGDLYGYSIPHLGDTAAGPPRDPNWEPGQATRLHEMFAGEVYTVTVHGTSMTGEQIADGDLVVVRRRPEAEHGETVLAWVDGGFTLKVMHVRGDGSRMLMPKGRKAKPIPVDADRDVRVFGVAVGVVRKY